MKVIYLENRDGHFKFYKMTKLSEDEWLAEYGRIGNAPLKKKYSMNVWQKKYQEKISKGYIDITSTVTSNEVAPSKSAVQIIISEKLIILKDLILSKNENEIKKIGKEQSNKCMIEYHLRKIYSWLL